jgi:NADH dehydrogenase [ubiquinone] 1 alpha subcomplex assembly factor 5
MYGGEDDDVPATYQILYFICWKPHEKHLKPAKRGSGEVSFKDLNKIDEIIDNKKKTQK